MFIWLLVCFAGLVAEGFGWFLSWSLLWLALFLEVISIFSGCVVLLIWFLIVFNGFFGSCWDIAGYWRFSVVLVLLGGQNDLSM